MQPKHLWTYFTEMQHNSNKRRKYHTKCKESILYNLVRQRQKIMLKNNCTKQKTLGVPFVKHINTMDIGTYLKGNAQKVLQSYNK